MSSPGDDAPAERLEISISPADVGGVYANVARVTHSPFEFTLDFARVDFTQSPKRGIVTARVNMSPLLVSQLIEALERNWASYTRKAMPPEVTDHDNDADQDR